MHYDVYITFNWYENFLAYYKSFLIRRQFILRNNTTKEM